MERGDRPSTRQDTQRGYSLFPSVQPTSSQSLPKNDLGRASAIYQKKRSVSLDASARTAAARQNVPVKSVPAKRVQRRQGKNVNPMSAVQESSPIDSPSYPLRYSILSLSKTSDDSHNRTSSAHNDYIRDSQTLPSTRTEWTSKQLDTQFPAAPLGLGLSMPTSRLSGATTDGNGSQKPKPNLTIEVLKQDKPPPPPPKSPRHARTPSVQSGVSSMHGESPSSYMVTTPASIMRAALVDAQGSPVQMPPSILHVKQGSYSSSTSDFRIREVVLRKDSAGPTKVNSLSSDTQSIVRTSPHSSSITTAQPPHNSQTQSKDGTPRQDATPPSNHDRTTSHDQFMEKLTDLATMVPKGLEIKAPAKAQPAAKTEESREVSSPSMSSEKPAESVANMQAAATSMLARARQAQQAAAQSQQAAPQTKQATPRTQQATAQTQEATAQTSGPTVKPPKINLDKPMPNLPQNSGTFQDHIREVREAEKSERKKRAELRPSPPLKQGSTTSLPLASASTQGQSQPTKQDGDPKRVPNAAKAIESKIVDSRTKADTQKKPDSPRIGAPVSSLSTFPNTSKTELSTPKKSPNPAKGIESKPAESGPQANISKKPDGPQIGAPVSSLTTLLNTSKLDVGSLTPDSSSRPQSPPVSNAVVDLAAKPLPIPISQRISEARSATPDIVATTNVPTESEAETDPVQVLKDISTQVDALHARYTQLRRDRLKLSTAITASLKDQKPGSDYANTLLDQHFSINALNSSMDICFAKLKALDCRKEDAIAVLIGRAQLKPVDGEEPTFSEPVKPNAVAALVANPSGRSTPDVEQKTLTPSLFSLAKSSPSIAPPTSSGQPTPDLGKGSKAISALEKPDGKKAAEAEKRVTAIRETPATSSNDQLDNGKQNPPVSPISVSAPSIDDERPNTRRIRIKGAKAAKLLGLVADESSKPGSPEITLPDASSLERRGPGKQLDIEVEIQSKFADRTPRPSPQVPPKTSVPKRKPIGAPRKGTNDSVGSITASSMSESAPEEAEANTPRTSQDATPPFGLKSTKRGLLQTIQVFVDDDILDYYKEASDGVRHG